MRSKSHQSIHIKPTEGASVWIPGVGIVTRKVPAAQTAGAYSLLEFEVGPRGGSPLHIQHREDECIYVLEGRFGLLIEDQKSEVGPGSLVYLQKGTLHSFENLGEGVGRLMVLYTPGGSHERFFEEVGEPITNLASEGMSSARSVAEVPPGPKEIERLAAMGAEYGIEIVEPP